MKILITGASGEFGRLATERLLKRVSPSDLILVTRTPASLSDRAAEGAEVRAGDFDQPESLVKAFSGAQRMLLISTRDVGRRYEQHDRAINAAKEAGVEHIVYTSSDGSHPDNPAVIANDHLQTEILLEKSGLDYTIMRDSLYANSAAELMAPPALATGVWQHCSGDQGIGFIPREDCVDCAIEVLTSNGHAGKIYKIAGESTWSFAQVGELLTEVFDTPISMQNITAEERDAELAALGVPAHFEDGLDTLHTGASARDDIVSYECGIAGGFFNTTSKDVRTLLGRAPMSLRDYIIEHKSEISERSKLFNV